jgi:hypothetical protein
MSYGIPQKMQVGFVGSYSPNRIAGLIVLGSDKHLTIVESFGPRQPSQEGMMQGAIVAMRKSARVAGVFRAK